MSSHEAPATLTEVPNIRVDLARIAIVSSAEYFWDPGQEVRYFDVFTQENDTKIGTIDVDYSNSYDRLAQPHIDLTSHRNGYGTEIYTTIPFMPLPSGKNFLDAGYTLSTTYYERTGAATALWESLLRKGLASRKDIKHLNDPRTFTKYSMLHDIPAPPHLEVTELIPAE